MKTPGTVCLLLYVISAALPGACVAAQQEQQQYSPEVAQTMATFTHSLLNLDSAVQRAKAALAHQGAPEEIVQALTRTTALLQQKLQTINTALAAKIPEHAG